MKKSIKLLLAIFCAIALNSCSNSSDDNDPVTTTLNGTWRLANVSGGITGISDDFDDASITWTFNPDGSINIWNTNTDDTKQDLIETGDYDYAIVPNEATPELCSQAMVINSVSYGCYSISGDTLTLSQIESDGYQVTLIKIGPVTF